MSARAIAIRPALSLFAASLLLVGLSGCHFFNVPGEFEREEEVAGRGAPRPAAEREADHGGDHAAAEGDHAAGAEGDHAEGDEPEHTAKPKEKVVVKKKVVEDGGDAGKDVNADEAKAEDAPAPSGGE